MLQVKQLDHINLPVKNLKESIQFYKELFGMETYEKGTTSDGVPYELISLPGVLGLCIYERPEQAQKVAKNLGHIGLHIKNFTEIEKTLEEKGIKVEQKYDYPNSTSIYIEDPNGLEIELSSSPVGGH